MKKLGWRYAAFAVVIWTIVLVLLLTSDGGDAAVRAVQGKRETGYGVVRYEGKGPEFWHYRAVTQTRKLIAARAELRRAERLRAKRFRRDVAYALSLAAAVFSGVSERELRAVASCETGGTFDPFARNRRSSASGLFQFLPSTWRDQGLAGHSVWDPVANALGAARIANREGWRQWDCQP